VTFKVELRPVRRRGLLRRKAAAEPVGEATLGAEFAAVMARVPPGWTRTLDGIAEGAVFGRLEARMAATELSRISPYAETPAEQAEFGAFRRLVERCAQTEGQELVIS
jgi:hypothetical protein